MTGAAGEGISQHPVDRLIRELLRTGRAATPEEIGRIVERLATAPFDPRVIPVAVRQRGLAYRGTILGRRADALTYHLIQRVVQDGQWVQGTTADQYLADLRRAVRIPGSRLTVYDRRGGPIAATVTPTEQILPVNRRGGEALGHLLVIYAVDRGNIISGYQFSALEKTGIPKEARWLK